MNIQFITICFLFLINMNFVSSQEVNLLLEIKEVDRASMVKCEQEVPNGRRLSTNVKLRMLQCELKNISNEIVTINHFMTEENLLQVESPSGKLSNVGNFLCGLDGGISLLPEETSCWNVNLNRWLFFYPK